MTTLLLLRHGETEWNREHRLQGQTDVPLSELGLAQAREAAVGMARFSPDVIFSSVQSRALKTAELVAEASGISLIADERLREVDCGSWTGRTWKEIIAEDPGIAHLDLAGVDFRRSPEGETETEVADRVGPALSEWLEEYTDKTVLVVGHGLALRVGMSRVLGCPDSLSWRLATMSNCHYSKIVRKHSLNRLVVYNAPASVAQPRSRVQPVQ